MTKLFFVLMILGGCATEVHGPFNRDDEQDPTCYARSGARPGYCDVNGGHK